jgi:hypothetical protein
VRKYLLFALLFIIPFVINSQESYTVTRSVFLPPVYYVGDRVELRVSVQLKAPGEVQEEEVLMPGILPVESIPDVGWGTIHSIEVLGSGDNREIRVSFTPFVTGTLSLPEMVIGNFTLNKEKIYVGSLLDEGYSVPADLQRQILLPATRLIIGLILTAIVGIPLLVLGFTRWWKARLLNLLRRYKENRPYKRMQRVLRQLRTEISVITGRDFYILLLEELRSYMTSRFGADYMTATSREISGRLKRIIKDPEKRQLVLDVFSFGDLVKFGGVHASIDRKRDDLEEVNEFLQLVEKTRSEYRKMVIEGAVYAHV